MEPYFQATSMLPEFNNPTVLARIEHEELRKLSGMRLDTQLA